MIRAKLEIDGTVETFEPRWREPLAFSPY